MVLCALCGQWQSNHCKRLSPSFTMFKQIKCLLVFILTSSPAISVVSMEARTAGIVIVGEEILKGRVQDVNSNFICKRLYELSISVKKICVVEDSINEIAKVVSDFSKSYDIVFTSGGIGPTHDDVTFQGIAAAFNENVYVNNILNTFWMPFYTDVLKNNAKVMSNIPKSAEIIWAESSFGFSKKMPIVKVHNVFIFPGVPQYLQLAFTCIEKTYFQNSSFKFNTTQLYLNVDEGDIVPALNKAVDKFKDSVIFGSYPKFNKPMFKTEITMESLSTDTLKEAVEYFKSLVPSSWIYVKSDMYNKIQQLINSTSNREFAVVLQNSIKVIEQSLEKYPPEACFISFNGGKDCTVLVHLIAAVWDHHGIKTPLNAVYFRIQDPFPEVDAFINEIKKRYNLVLLSTPGPIKLALRRVIEETPNFKAVFMGSRRSDPHCQQLNVFQMTDHDWPQIVRVNLLLDWTHSDVWTFLKQLSLPYCSLYDYGFTSLGNRNNTKPNPTLRYVDESGEVKYRPAYTLHVEATERDGRI